MRSLPRVVSQIPSDLRNFLDRVREYLSEGGENRFVTVRELRAGGIVGTTPGGTITAPTEYTSVDPTIPTGLITSGALASIIVEWDPANYLGHSRTEVWAATTNNFALRELVGTSEGSVFSHSIGAGATWYYWIRFVNTNEVAGPYNSTTGTVGVTSQDPDYLIEVLSDAYGVTGDAPFFQIDSPTVINGVTIPAGTYIKQAWIADATISRAKIQDLAVDSAKISDLTATKITAGNIQTGYIRSTSYSAGTLGWSINADGSANFNGALTASGATAYSTGTGLFSGYDGGVYKFRVGTASGNRLYWDGSGLNVEGSISGSSISGGTISGSDIYAGTVRTSNTTTYSSENGFYLSGTQFRIGDPAGAYMRWTGSALELSTSATNLINTPNITTDSVTQFDVYTLPTTTLTLPAVSAGASATTTLLSSIIGPATDISTQRVLLVSLKFSNYDTTPGYFQLNLPGRSFIQDVGVRLIDGSNINNFSYICPVSIGAGVTNIGSVTLTLFNGPNSNSYWGGPPDCQGNVVLLTRKR